MQSSSSRTRSLFEEAKGAVDSMLGRGVDFSAQPLGRHADPSGLAGYYCDFRHKAQSAARQDDGIPLDGHGRRDDWVIAIAQAALGFWELRCDGAPGSEAGFLRLARWLAEHAEPGAGGMLWRVDMPVPKYGLDPGWASAMGQGEAMSVLLRAHALTGDDDYLRLAREAARPLEVEVDDGGLVRRLDGHPVLEEYPAAKPVAVLNGWIFALFGLHELTVVDGDERARRAFDRSYEGLLALLPRYDVGWWSLYSLCDHHGRADLSKPFYQALHPVLLRALNLVRPDRLLVWMAGRWEDQRTPLALARISQNKLRFRVHRARRERA